MNAVLQIETGRRRSYVIAASLISSAWLALALWSVSPYAEWLDHARIEDIAAPPIVRLAVFTLGWTLMIIAMMLPGTMLMLARCLGDMPFSARQIALVILPYLAVWMVFGGFSYLGDSVLHEIVEHLPALAGVIAPGVLLVAGLYQLTPLKRGCLSRCRSEGAAFMAFKQSSGRNPWSLGLRYGVVCLGNCWALMLIMFALGGVNLIWMLVLGMIMAAERLTHQGVYYAQLLGVLLVLSSVVLFVSA